MTSPSTVISRLLLCCSITTASVQAASVNGFDLQAYGFIKASAIYADSALASYNNINLSAPTHAVAQTRGQDKSSRLSFQTAQSRIGTTIGKDNILARMEFDFIDFNKSSPTTQMNPRVRIAAITYSWDNNKVIIGQDWDLFSPVTSYTFDIVGLYFMAGNTGFMRQQAQYLKTYGDWEIGGALGMAGNNPGSQDQDLEIGKSPTYALRISRLVKDGRVGLSAIYSTLHFNNGVGTNTVSRNTDSYGYNAFYEQKFGRLALKSEAYYGQNMNNIGTLAIGKGTAGSDVKEFGGMLTGIYGLADQHFVFAGVGTAKIDNKSELAPFAPNPSTTGLISSPGVRSNFLSRVGYEYRITSDFSWMTEVSRFETNSKLAGDSYQNNVAYMLESGVQLRF